MKSLDLFDKRILSPSLILGMFSFQIVKLLLLKVSKTHSFEPNFEGAYLW